MGGHLLSLYSASQASRIKRLTTNLPLSIRVRIILTLYHASTAEEFKRVAEEMTRQGFASQTVEKAQDGGEEATVGEDSTFESVKEAYKELPPCILVEDGRGNGLCAMTIPKTNAAIYTNFGNDISVRSSSS